MVDFLQISLMIPGHTKFDVDWAFSTTSTAYANADVFTTDEPATVMSESPQIIAIVDNGKLVYPWLSIKTPWHQRFTRFRHC